MTACDSEAVWRAVIEAEDAHGEEAEAFARARAAAAREARDAALVGFWKDVASELHILHTINRTWARPRGGPLPEVGGGHVPPKSSV